MKEKSWGLVDAQKLAEEFPYTFYKPSRQLVSQLKPGNQVKLIFEFRSDDAKAPSAERMWVDIVEVSDEGFYGLLDNEPAYIEDLKYKDSIHFYDIHIIDSDLDDPVPSLTEKYVKRCFVTNNILYHGEKVGYLYREDPDTDDDSGWRINTGTETEEYMDNADNISYVSLGAVLREDDSIIHLLERDSGSAFVRDDSGNYIELE